MSLSSDRHLTGPELVRLTEPGLRDDVKARLAPDAAVRAHLLRCAVCRDRLDALRREEDALSAALADLDAESLAPAESARLDALTDRMMDRLHADVRGGVDVPASSAVAPSRARASHARPSVWGAALLAAAAGLALVLAHRPTAVVATRIARDTTHPAPRVAPSPAAPVVLARVDSVRADAVRRQIPRSARHAPTAAGAQLARAVAPVADAADVGDDEVTRGGSLLPPLEVELARVLAQYTDAVLAHDTARVHTLRPSVPDDTLRAIAAGQDLSTPALRSVRRLAGDDVEVVVRTTAREIRYAFRRTPAGWVIAGIRPDD